MERSDTNLTMRTAIWTAVLIGVFVVGLAAGRSYQHMKSGYWFRAIDEREIPFAPGVPLRLQRAFKTIGLPFLETESSILILDDDHCGKVTLYEAKRGFQESYPFVKDVAVEGNEITWQDGRFSYQLKIDLLASNSATPPDNN
jgi:hypothetical protein